MRGLKPIETKIWIVGPLLLRKKQHKAVTVRERRPSGAKVVPCRGLGASVQHDDERGIVGKARRSIDEHSQIARVRSEPDGFPQRAGNRTCMSGAIALQRPNQFPPSSPTAEAECPSQCSSRSIPCCRDHLIAAVHNARGTNENCRKKRVRRCAQRVAVCQKTQTDVNEFAELLNCEGVEISRGGARQTEVVKKSARGSEIRPNDPRRAASVFSCES